MNLRLTNLISDMERDMRDKYSIKEVEFLGFVNPHGFVRVRDETGQVWHCHPESFTATGESPAPVLESCLQRDKHKPGEYCSNCRGWA